MIRTIFLSSLFVASLVLGVRVSYAADPVSPLQEVRGTLDEVIKIIEKLPGETNTTVRRKEMREILAPRFDFEEMARRSLGAAWKDRSEAERSDFISVFSELLARTYVARIETVKPGMVSFESESVETPKALVKTMVKVDGDSFPIDYRLALTDRWRVYDVIIENIGLVANYRNEFASIIRREEFSGLMKSLREKLEKR